jgi:hypothetical protein
MRKNNPLGEFNNKGSKSSETDSYYDDENFFDDQSEPTKKPRTRFQRFVKVLSFWLVGSAIAATITLSVNQNVEFGTGLTQLQKCTPTLTIAPVSGYENGGSGTFTMDAVDINGIPDSCIGYDFQIKIWDKDTQQPLKVTDSSLNASQQIDYVRVSMLPGKDFAIVGTPNAYVDILDTSTTTDNQISIVYDAGALTGDISHYADARNTYKVTVETFKTGS